MKQESKLKRSRIAAGFTQEQLADISGVNIKSLASYEQDASRLSKASVQTVIKLADSLGCTVEDLVDRNYIERV